MDAVVSERSGSGGRVYVVFSNTARSGKTLFSRVLAQWIKLEREFVAVDTQDAESGISHFFPSQSRCVDITEVHALVELFDCMLGDDGRDYIIELPYHNCEHFFKTLSLIGPLAERLSVIGFNVLSEPVKSEQKFLLPLQRACPNLNIVTVRNHWRASSPERYHPGRLRNRPSKLEVIMPVIEDDALRLIENQSFRFELQPAGKSEFIGDYGTEAVADWTRWMFRQLWQCSLEVRLLDLWRVPA